MRSKHTRFRYPCGRRAIIPVMIAASVVAGACGSSAKNAANNTAPNRTTTTLCPPPTTLLAPVRQGDPTGANVTVPTEEGCRPIESYVDLGTQILITAAGFVPKILQSNYDLQLTWTNLTTSVQEITFTSYKTVSSPPIPPGGKWHYTARLGGNLQETILKPGCLVTNCAGVVDFS